MSILLYFRGKNVQLLYHTQQQPHFPPKPQQRALPHVAAGTAFRSSFRPLSKIRYSQRDFPGIPMSKEICHLQQFLFEVVKYGYVHRLCMSVGTRTVYRLSLLPYWINFNQVFTA
jgi:hypothetical protein